VIEFTGAQRDPLDLKMKKSTLQNRNPFFGIQLEPNNNPLDLEKTPYWCTWWDCSSNFGSKYDWKRHEEGHWAQECYICLICATVRNEVTGFQCCIGCYHRFGSYVTIDVAGNHILQCELVRERSEKFASYDHLCSHLRIQHDMKSFDNQSSAWSFPIESNWPRECGFCGAKFAHWQDRADHLEAHFLQGQSASEVLLQPFNVDNLQSMAEQGASINLSKLGNILLTKLPTETTRYYPGDGWNTACLATPNLSDAKLEALQSRNGIEKPNPDDCPLVVTGNTVGRCSCLGILPFSSREQIRLRSISRALHVSRTKLLLRATGEWLWYTTEFQNWRSLHQHSLLLVIGSSGSGKSILTSAVIRYLEGDKKDGEVVAFYCCDGRYKSSNAASDIMVGLFAELQNRMTGGSAVTRPFEDTMDQERGHAQLSRVSLRSLFMAIEHSLEEEETLILVLDGLDEVQGGHEVLEELLTLTSQHEKSHRIKILVSSRREFAVRGDIETPLQIDMDTRTSVFEDMKDYTESIVSKNLVASDAGTAIRKISEKSRGRFLCMTLLLLILPHNPSSANLNDWLVSVMGDDDTAKSPFTIYHYMYQSIAKPHHLFALYMLQWVLHAARPMYSWELLNAVNSGLGTNYHDADVERATGGLFTLSRTRTVNLVHLSLREYLLRIKSNSFPHDPQEMITRVCLRALSPALILQSLDQPLPDNYAMDIQSVQSNTLDIYAKKYWMHHYLLAEPRSTCTSGLLHEMLRKIFSPWKMRQRDDPKLETMASKTLLGMENDRLEQTSLDAVNMTLRIGASFGFYKLAKLELDMGATDHIISSHTENSLHLAAIAGHTSLVKLFIQYGANVTTLCKSGFTPLFHAIASGHHDVMQLLLETGTGTSSAAGAPFYESMEELKLEPVFLERCSKCGHTRTSFIVGI
jgi:Cdc6-like AAA superfamily ATPase